MAILTNQHYVNVIQNLINDLTNTENNYYVFMGRTNPWTNDTSPPSAVNSYYEYEQSIYHDMTYGKLLNASNISFMIPNYPWTSNVVYAQYDPTDSLLFTKQFYVVNDSNQVYKCLDNNNGAPSTIKPFLTSPSGTFSTGDGYLWKYMYTIDSISYSNFATAQFVPVLQDVNVAASAIPGTIDNLNITNSGSNYQAYHDGILQSFVNQYSVQVANTASSLDNFYANSSIYFKSGFGSGQIRKIASYSGSSKLVTVYTPFNVYVNLNLGNINGTIQTGQSVEQRTDSIAYVYQSGFFNVNDTVYQTDNGATGAVISANSSVVNIYKTSNTYFNVSNNTPIFNTNQGGSIKNGTVTVTNGNNQITAISGTQFTTDYAVNQYIRVGSDTNNNIRRITAVNSSIITVSVPFYNSFSANVHYAVTSALEPTSLTVTDTVGTITQTNLSSIKLTFDTVSSPNLSYINGEIVKCFTSTGVDLSANGTVIFANSSTLVLNNIQGVFSVNTYITGQSSTLNSRIANMNSFPNITVSSTSGAFTSGQPINIISNLGQLVANATVLTFSTSPNSLTEYIISPTVNIVGDGVGAAAYCVCNTNQYSSYEIDNIILLNSGNNYTYANVTIEANGLFGSNAAVYASVSPITGHGSDVYSELGATYAGVSLTFDTSSNELYKFPTYGSYRRAGIIKNPSFNDVYLTVNNFSRVKLNVSNMLTNYVVNEFVTQPSSNACGILVYSNSSFIELANVQGTYVTGANVVGLTSGATSNVVSANVTSFSISSNVESVSDGTSWATATITQVIDQNHIRLSNVSGIISANDTLIDYNSNTYATVANVAISNNTVDVTNNFGVRFNQTARITLSSNSGVFANNEYINQAISGASGRIISTSDEIDLLYTANTGVFTKGLVLTNANTGANGVITFANTTYIKLISNSSAWSTNNTITTLTANGTISNTYPVLRLNDVNGTFQTTNSFIGNTSGAVGYSTFQNTMEYPDLIRNTGKVIYINDIAPITKSLVSKEEIKLIIKF